MLTREVVTLDAQANTLRLRLAPDAAPTQAHLLPGVIDIGEGGALLGVEINVATAARLHFPAARLAPAWEHDPVAGSLYVQIDSVSDSAQVRSVPVTVRMLTSENGTLVAVEIPRRGHGYEISYPSGNR